MSVIKQEDALSSKWWKHVSLFCPVMSSVVHWTTIITSSSKALNLSWHSQFYLMSVCLRPCHLSESCFSICFVELNGWSWISQMHALQKRCESLFLKLVPSSMHLSICPSIHSSIHPLMHPPTHHCILGCIYEFIYFLHPFIFPSIHCCLSNSIHALEKTKFQEKVVFSSLKLQFLI